MYVFKIKKIIVFQEQTNNNIWIVIIISKFLYSSLFRVIWDLANLITLTEW